MRALACVAGLLAVSLALSQEPRFLSDAEVRQLIIQASIRAYSGNCPCPFNVDRAGRRCGGRSAYSRPRGASPICYANQISDAQVRRYHERHDIQEERAETGGN